jgi:hypothetical protein
MTILELAKEIYGIIEARQKHREEHGDCYWIERKFSIARLKRLRLTLNELIKKEEH